MFITGFCNIKHFLLASTLLTNTPVSFGKILGGVLLPTSYYYKMHLAEGLLNRIFAKGHKLANILALWKWYHAHAFHFTAAANVTNFD